MRDISLGYSPCPNDTFIFYALSHGKIDTGDLNFKERLLDVETLNQKAKLTELDITKVSYHAIGHLREKYCLLRSGSAMGRGCGPLIVAKEELASEDLQRKKIAIPGRLTTAYLLLQLYFSSFPLHPAFLIEMSFDKIINSVKNRDVDAGLIIHEGRFTYAFHGLKKIADLGEWWEKETGLPIPLGGIIAKRGLGEEIIGKIDYIIRSSVEYALKNRHEPRAYVKEHSQEIGDDVIEQHINLYVNDYSLDIGEEGISAVKEVFRRAEKAGIIEKSRYNFLCAT
ncbi:MAG: 1,4-dihydroxy-6-naphthoate synthase [Nitrospirota bacterium]